MSVQLLFILKPIHDLKTLGKRHWTSVNCSNAKPHTMLAGSRELKNTKKNDASAQQTRNIYLMLL